MKRTTRRIQAGFPRIVIDTGARSSVAGRSASWACWRFSAANQRGHALLVRNCLATIELVRAHAIDWVKTSTVSDVRISAGSPCTGWNTSAVTSPDICPGRREDAGGQIAPAGASPERSDEGVNRAGQKLPGRKRTIVWIATDAGRQADPLATRNPGAVRRKPETRRGLVSTICSQISTESPACASPGWCSGSGPLGGPVAAQRSLPPATSGGDRNAPSGTRWRFPSLDVCGEDVTATVISGCSTTGTDSAGTAASPRRNACMIRSVSPASARTGGADSALLRSLACARAVRASADDCRKSVAACCCGPGQPEISSPSRSSRS